MEAKIRAIVKAYKARKISIEEAKKRLSLMSMFIQTVSGLNNLEKAWNKIELESFEQE